MCGRFSLKASPDDLRKVLGAELPQGYQPRYNIAPTQDVLGVVVEDGVRDVRALRWGLVPFWADDPRIGNRMINARAETVAEKPSYRDSLVRRRCLIAADGFFEWQVTGTGKRPVWIHRPGEVPFCFAGLWARWRRGPEVLESCTILTQPADAHLRPIHDRMPVLLDPRGCARWMDTEADPAALLAGVVVGSPFDLEIRPVSPAVNRPVNDGPACIERVED